ncbi:NADP-dependent 3-hydroxy acid dehydrogenase YdfG [Saccharicrinis carchari]|uniref:NADP-dependent 3-hydroxy acid dehydrogenase YdfG n=1 Tax=Saccharicrinis carchari TaxID=1168039 RepID=A0A521E333_SACCC|nr:SDR family NAD(P)-dependent oxidoreductase [Saccharicrinis carchari]SMO78322.1 NADP-dependent 3-hydroxy acid dehydrogenase YdfG [Saccharicrinis carchari]
METNKIALITGATSGIGEATSKELAQLGYNTILTGRRSTRLNKLKQEIETTYQTEVLTLCFDIQDQQQTTYALNSIPTHWRNIDVLINNAGLAYGAEKIDEDAWDKWAQMLDTNVKGLLFLSKEVIKWMVQKKQGHIVNISSIAGINVYEGGSIYCASKHAVNAITKGMRIDLLKHNIKVTSVSPGMVETEFSLVRYDGNRDKANQVYRGITPLSAIDVAEAIVFVVSRPAHVNINDILIMPTQQADAYNTYRK